MSSKSKRKVKDYREASRRYKLLVKAAFDEMRQGNDDHLIANKCLSAVLAAPSKWDTYRWIMFHEAAHRLVDLALEEKIMTADCKELKDIYKDKTEPVLFRSDAVFSLGFINLYAGENERSAKYFRTALDLIQTASSSERNCETLADPETGSVSGAKTVGELLDKIALFSKENLEEMESSVPKKLKATPDDFAVKRRLYTGGGKCDCCGKDRSKVQGGLYRCSQCKLAYYCSPECQSQSWEDGHWNACRAPTQIEVGDYMVIKGLERRPDLNFSVARDLGPAPGGRWQVSVHSITNTLSLLPEKLYHIRPAC